MPGNRTDYLTPLLISLDVTERVAKPNTRLSVETVVKIRPCQRIEIEADEDNDLRETIAKRYAKLTTELPLAGGPAMTRTSSGEIMLVAELRRLAPWCEPAIAVVEQSLELQLLLGRPWVAFPPLLMLGPPGVGKTHFARLISDIAGTGTGTADLAGCMDASIIAGNPRGWTSAQPVFPALLMNQAVTANPLAVVEEVDKAGGSARYGDPIAAMLGLLEASSSTRYYDKCLLAEVNVGNVNWMMTANAVTPRLPAPFLSRLTIVEISPPPVAMFEQVLASLTEGLIDRWNGRGQLSIDLPRKVRRTLKDDFAKHRSVRRLGQLLQRVAPACLQGTTRH